ncbi:MAG: membrane protein insertion efficiency factor YidD [Candidatus Melainabacteria bacterium]|nr:membrane protein insertion efficiency factor YidD [Candidatus Melainabacteria bacterium]
MRFSPASFSKGISTILIRGWQATRILRRPSCRFYPSCSEYTLGCILRHGLVRGVLLGGWRLLRCNPWNLGGIDEVPEASSFVSLFRKDASTR